MPIHDTPFNLFLVKIQKYVPVGITAIIDIRPIATKILAERRWSGGVRILRIIERLFFVFQVSPAHIDEGYTNISVALGAFHIQILAGVVFKTALLEQIAILIVGLFLQDSRVFPL